MSGTIRAMNRPGPDAEAATSGAQSGAETRVFDSTGLDAAAAPRTAPSAEGPSPTEADQLLARFNAADTGFQLIRPLGVGGMGTVFLAEQAQPQRQVAIKLIHAAQASEEMRARFRLEAEVLARLQHPGIAEIHAAGEAQLGDTRLPYLAIELIDGLPLGEWARQRQPALRQRIALLAAICDAVEHAHQRGVIHRDLKPANILVTAADEPKVLDFGVARVTDVGTGLDSQLTTAGFVVGTLLYMSPEQTRGDSNDVDTRSDVYALGVLGFELVTGEYPHAFSSHDPFVVVDAIRNLPPRRAGQLCAEARGDVEIILGKALEKDRARRYQSAGALAEDLRSLLDNRSIKARPPTLGYRLGKFAQRNPLLSLSLLVALVSMLGAAAAVTSFALSEQQARRAAEAEAHKAQATLAFLSSVLSQANPVFSRGQELSVREALESASQGMASALANLPAVEATVRQTIGSSFNSLGRFDAAERELRRAVEVALSSPEVDEATRIGALLSLSEALATQGRMIESLDFQEQAEARVAALAKPDPATLLRTDHARLSLDYHMDQAVDLRQRSAELLQRARAAQPSDHRRTAFLMELHAYASEREDPAQSLSQRREAIELLSREFGELSPDVLTARDNLASALMRLGELEQALEIRQGIHQQLIQVLGPAHPTTLAAGSNLAHLWQNTLGAQQAIELLQAQAELARQLPDSLAVGHVIQQGLAAAYYAQGDIEAAMQASQLALDGMLHVYGERHPETILSMSSYATLLALQDRNEQAAPWFERAQAAVEQNLGPDHPQSLNVASEYAAFLRDAGRLDESLQRFADLLERLQRLEGPNAPQTLMTIYQYTGALQRAGRFAEALPLTERLLQQAPGVLGSGNPFTLLAPNRHARSLIGVGQLEPAEVLLEESWNLLYQSADANPSFAGYVAESLQMLAQARGDEAMAEHWAGQARQLLRE